MQCTQPAKNRREQSFDLQTATNIFPCERNQRDKLKVLGRADMTGMNVQTHRMQRITYTNTHTTTPPH